MAHPPLPETTDPSTQSEPTGWPEDALREQLVGSWHIHQRIGGHRTSTDDVITAWFAVQEAAGVAPQRYLDLGCGIGSVMLLTAHRLRPGFTLGVEAQAQSALMASRSVAELPDPPEIQVRHSDFRSLSAEELGRFPLITGSPPYFPVGTGVLSPDAQRRACRFELRGGVEAYCATGARLLAPGGVLVLVFPTEGDARVRRAGADAGLHLRACAEIASREGRGSPFLSLYAFRHEPGTTETTSFAIRDAEGAITSAYRAARTALGLPTSR